MDYGQACRQTFTYRITEGLPVIRRNRGTALRSAWRGIVPAAGAKHEVGRRMPVSTRFIFWLDGTVLTGFGFIL